MSCRRQDPISAACTPVSVRHFADHGPFNHPRLKDLWPQPRSPYELMAGTVIAAALVTGINSDLPGQTIATVTQNLNDTVTGNFLVVPQGSKMPGQYDPRSPMADGECFSSGRVSSCRMVRQSLWIDCKAWPQRGAGGVVPLVRI